MGDLFLEAVMSIFDSDAKEPLAHDLRKFCDAFATCNVDLPPGSVASSLAEALPAICDGKAGPDATRKSLATIEGLKECACLLSTSRGKAWKDALSESLAIAARSRRCDLALNELELPLKEALQATRAKLRARQGCVVVSVQKRVVRLQTPVASLRKLRASAPSEWLVAHDTWMQDSFESINASARSMWDNVLSQWSSHMAPIVEFVCSVFTGTFGGSQDEVLRKALKSPPLLATLQDHVALMDLFEEEQRVVILEELQRAKDMHAALSALAAQLVADPMGDVFSDEWTNVYESFQPDGAFSEAAGVSWMPRFRSTLEEATQQRMGDYVVRCCKHELSGLAKGVKTFSSGKKDKPLKLKVGDMTEERLPELSQRVQLATPHLKSMPLDQLAKEVKELGGVGVVALLPCLAALAMAKDKIPDIVGVVGAPQAYEASTLLCKAVKTARAVEDAIDASGLSDQDAESCDMFSHSSHIHHSCVCLSCVRLCFWFDATAVVSVHFFVSGRTHS